MRAVADACRVSLGSLYNYFPSKDALVLAAIQSVWEDIFHPGHRCAAALPFPEYVGWLFERVRQSATAYPNFFTAHSVGVAGGGKALAKETTEHYFSHIKRGMAEALQADAAVRPDAFGPGFSEADFLDFVLENLLALLMQHRPDCAVLQQIIRRTLYR